MKGILKILVLCACVWLLSTKVDWPQVAKAMEQASLAVIALGILIETSAHFVDAGRQWLWLRNGEKPVRFVSFLKARYFSAFLANFLPSALVGDAFRAGYLSREIGMTAASWASTVMVRVIGLVVTLGVLAVGLSFRFVEGPENMPWVFASLAVPLLIFFVLLKPAFIRYFLGLGHRIGVPFVSKLEQFLLVLSSYRLETRKILAAVVLSVYYQLSTVLLVFWICSAFGLATRFVELMFHVPLISFIVMVPASYNGIGIQDVSWVYLMKGSGHAEETLLAISILWHVIRIAATLPGGLLFLGRSSRANDPAATKSL